MQKFKKKNFKSTKGITLIALVVTIIILLILAGVSIAMLTGNNGVLTQGKRAKEETEIAEEKEAISLAMNALKIQKQVGAKESGRKVALNNEPKEEVLDAQSKNVIKFSSTSTNSIIITPEELKEEMDKGNPKPESVTQGDDDGLEVTFGVDRKNRSYDVTQAGVITKKAQLTPEEAAKIVDVIGYTGEKTYVLTAGGEVKATSVTQGNIFGTLKTTDEVITKNGVKKKYKNSFIDKKGKVYTWGENYYGQLGDGTTNDSNIPICISDIENSQLKGKNIVDVYCDNTTIISKDNDGKLYSWGDNNRGKLGNGTTTDSSMPICISDIESSPLKGKKIVDAHSDGFRIIAKDSNGKLYTWGDNNSGELGNGTTTDSSMPICISDIENSPLKGKNIVDVYDGSIAKDSNGKLYSWGYNNNGQLGNGTTENSSMPICISDIENSPLKGKNIVDVHNYDSTIIAKDSSGKLYTWGNNYYGQLGNGTTTNSSMPICISEVEGSPLKGKNIVEIYRYEYVDSVIARDSAGKLYTWGYNDYGQLGNGTTTNSSMPVCISDIKNSPLNGKNIVDIYIERIDYLTVSIKDSNGKIYAWGSNKYGQVGDGTKINSSFPVCINDIENSELKNTKIKKIEFYEDGANYYITEDGECYIYSYTVIYS